MVAFIHRSKQIENMQPTKPVLSTPALKERWGEAKPIMK
jgi:hypothetical protein